LLTHFLKDGNKQAWLDSISIWVEQWTGMHHTAALQLCKCMQATNHISMSVTWSQLFSCISLHLQHIALLSNHVLSDSKLIFCSWQNHGN